MPQLLVRKIESAVVDRLKEEAFRQGVSVEEAHRRLLRRTLLNEPEGKKLSFKEYLLEMPDGGPEEDIYFEQPRELPGPPIDLS